MSNHDNDTNGRDDGPAGAVGVPHVSLRRTSPMPATGPSCPPRLSRRLQQRSRRWSAGSPGARAQRFQMTAQRRSRRTFLARARFHTSERPQILQCRAPLRTRNAITSNGLLKPARCTPADPGGHVSGRIQDRMQLRCQAADLRLRHGQLAGAFALAVATLHGGIFALFVSLACPRTQSLGVATRSQRRAGASLGWPTGNGELSGIFGPCHGPPAGLYCTSG
jgi:hypothetical protein